MTRITNEIQQEPQAKKTYTLPTEWEDLAPGQTEAELTEAQQKQRYENFLKALRQAYNGDLNEGIAENTDIIQILAKHYQVEKGWQNKAAGEHVSFINKDTGNVVHVSKNEIKHHDANGTFEYEDAVEMVRFAMLDVDMQRDGFFIRDASPEQQALIEAAVAAENKGLPPEYQIKVRNPLAPGEHASVLEKANKIAAAHAETVHKTAANGFFPAAKGAATGAVTGAVTDGDDGLVVENADVDGTQALDPAAVDGDQGPGKRLDIPKVADLPPEDGTLVTNDAPVDGAELNGAAATDCTASGCSGDHKAAAAPVEADDGPLVLGGDQLVKAGTDDAAPVEADDGPLVLGGDQLVQAGTDDAEPFDADAALAEAIAADTFEFKDEPFDADAAELPADAVDALEADIAAAIAADPELNGEDTVDAGTAEEIDALLAEAIAADPELNGTAALTEGTEINGAGAPDIVVDAADRIETGEFVDDGEPIPAFLANGAAERAIIVDAAATFRNQDLFAKAVPDADRKIPVTDADLINLFTHNGGIEVPTEADARAEFLTAVKDDLRQTGHLERKGVPGFRKDYLGNPSA